MMPMISKKDTYVSYSNTLMSSDQTTRSSPEAAPSRIRNILFIMCDQLRRDYLGCYGHPSISTPHIDALAKRGTRFTRCYVQGPVCGPSRMSTYTGRYVTSHGSTWNFVPLSVQLPTLGEYMRDAGLRTALIGKSHVVPDLAGLRRLGIDPNSVEGRYLANGGFEPIARHDGIVLDSFLARGPHPYNTYLHSKSYPGFNAWHDWANSGQDEQGKLQSGWRLRNSGYAARVRAEDSETAWTTDQAIDYIQTQGDKPWCLHVSYIKPHWPYIAPEPYHAMYGRSDIKAPVRSPAERTDAHPVYAAFREHLESRTFSTEEVRETVIPAYMGLVSEIDANLGRLMQAMTDAGRMDDTLIVFTSDHGDLLGDHWLGEKEMFYEPSAGVPLIVCDPRSPLRGLVNDSPVEAIDLIPTFLDALGQPPDQQRLEGMSLLPLVHGSTARLKDAAFSELDYAFYPARAALGLGPNSARAVMVCEARWKYVFYLGFPPQLFDLVNDPDELVDQGQNAAYAAVRASLHDRLVAWMAHRRNRATMADSSVDDLLVHRTEPGGVEIGVW